MIQDHKLLCLNLEPEIESSNLDDKTGWINWKKKTGNDCFTLWHKTLTTKEPTGKVLNR